MTTAPQDTPLATVDERRPLQVWLPEETKERLRRTVFNLRTTYQEFAQTAIEEKLAATEAATEVRRAS